MYKIVDKKVLNPTVVQLQIEAPLVANKAKPGQFIFMPFAFHKALKWILFHLHLYT